MSIASQFIAYVQIINIYAIHRRENRGCRLEFEEVFLRGRDEEFEFSKELNFIRMKRNQWEISFRLVRIESHSP